MDFICPVILHHCITWDIACCCHGYSGNHARASCHIRADFIPGRMSYTGVMSYPGGCHTRARCHIRADVLPGRDIIPVRMSYLGCINDATPAIVGSSCRLSEDDWVYFERSSTCNVPVRFTLLAGNTCYLEVGLEICMMQSFQPSLLLIHLHQSPRLMATPFRTR